PEDYDEIAVSEYYATCMVNWSYNYKDDSGNTVVIKNIDEIVNEDNPLYLTIGTTESKFSYKIVGIVNVGGIDKKFDKLMDDFDMCSAADQNEFFNYINNSFHLYAFVKSGFAEYAYAKYNTLFQYGNKAYLYQIATKTVWDNEDQPLIISQRNNFYRYQELKALTDNYFFIDDGKTELNRYEVLVDVSQFETLYTDIITTLVDAASADKRFNNEVENIVLSLNAAKDAKTTAEEKLTNLKSAIDKLNLVQAAMDNVSEITRDESIFNRYYTMGKYDTSVYEQGTANPVEIKLDQPYYKIVGFFAGVSIPKAGVVSMAMTDDSFESLGIRLEQGAYSALIATNLGGGNSRAMGSKLLNGSDVIYTCRNNAIALIKMNSIYFDKMADLFWIVSGIFAVFAIAMFANFIASSIKSKYGEIGILRALGARGRDVLNMFLVETVAVALVNAVFACLLAWGGGYLVNLYLAKFLNFYIPIATFGARQILIVSALSLAVGLVSAIIPIVIASSRKPVETIRRSM
ncbi:MAG: FtsX-like permease family protein, partial [Corallococcus sp.]|nr:FtsX-like permease family protein [Corallococcus sp.]